MRAIGLRNRGSGVRISLAAPLTATERRSVASAYRAHALGLLTSAELASGLVALRMAAAVRATVDRLAVAS